MLAMEANDNAGNLTPRGALSGSSRSCSLLQGRAWKSPGIHWMPGLFVGL